MKNVMKKIILVLGVFLPVFAHAATAELVKGFTLSEIGEFKYDANLEGAPTDAQKIVDKLFALGVRQVNLSPRAQMTDPRGTEVVPVTPAGADRSNERAAYLRLMKYIKGKGMKIGIRPIFFVVDNNGKTPYIEKLPNGVEKIWWHGNIQPKDPFKWFESFRAFLDNYLVIAKMGKADEFTIGAELYSMTVGIEDQWKEHPHGFPKEWLSLLTYARQKLNPEAKIMYDINFTDASINAGGVEQFGGEFARWKYRLVDLADDTNQHWLALKQFWNGLDAIGIDMYRSLATVNQRIPERFEDLVKMLQETSDRYASQIDSSMFEISTAVEKEQIIIFKEVGFRSVEKGFIDPFTYAGSGKYNEMHQAAAFEAFFQSFVKPNWAWYKGVVFWDVSVNPKFHGVNDLSFSPLEKEETVKVIKNYFN